MKKAYQRIDVEVFKKILREEYCPTAEKGASKKVLFEIIREISKVVIKIKGKDINKNEIIENINFKEFGFKEQSDVKIAFTETIFGHTELTLQAKNVYELQEGIELPIPRNNKQKQYQSLLSDTFERLKIKCENIISDTDEQKHIELYANKNIQTITRTFYEAKTLLYKSKESLNDKDRFYIYVQTLFILNTVLFMQNMFSSYYKEKKYSKQTLKLEMYDSVGPDLFSEPTAEYGNNNELNKTQKIRLTDNINVVITIYYEMMNQGVIEHSPQLVEDLIHNNYVSKSGKPINRLTIRTALKDYRPEKRAKGKKKLDISKYLEKE